MTINYTTLLGLALPVTGTESGTWGDDVSNGITQYIDASVAGTQSITTDADVTLSLTNGSSAGTNLGSTSAQYMQLLCTGSRTAARYINVPNSSKMYVVNNSTTGGYSITVRGVTGPTTGVTVINGEKAIIYWNSVSGDFVKISSNTITSFTGVLSPVNGGTGVANNAASTITISGSFGTTLTVTGTTAVTLPTSGTLLSTAAAVTPAQGGTGVTNGTNNTITFTGNYTLGLTLSANTAITLPTSGTLVNTAVTTLSSLVSVGTITTGTWNASSISTTYTAAKVTDVQAGTGVTLSGTTGSVTVNIGQAVGTASSVQFGSFGVGTAASGTTGEIRATNNVTAYYSSDIKFKENVQDIPDALGIVTAIGSKTFDWTDEYLAEHGGEDEYFQPKQSFGVIAQDVQKVFPQAVRTREDGSLAVDYEKLAILSFGAIGQLLKRVEVLESK